MGTWRLLGRGVRGAGQRDAVKRRQVGGMTLFLRSLTKGEGEWDSPLGLKDLCFQDQKDFILLTGPKLRLKGRQGNVEWVMEGMSPFGREQNPAKQRR